MANLRKGKVSDFIPDPANANQGTERGLRLLDDSLRQSGAGRSLLADKNGVLIAGNKTAERAVDIGLEDAIIIETDGTEMVIVQRKDLDINTPQGRQLAYADNRVSQVDLAWDFEQIAADIEDGMDLSGLFHDWELDYLKFAPSSEVDYAAEWQGMPEYESRDERPLYSIKVNFRSLEDLKTFADLIGQSLTEKTRSIWHPIKMQTKTIDQAWISDES